MGRLHSLERRLYLLKKGGAEASVIFKSLVYRPISIYTYSILLRKKFALFLREASIFGGFMIHKRFMRLSIALLLSLSVLEALMGATVQQVSDDYMLSYMNYFNVKKTDARYPVIAKIITDMFVKMNGGKAITDANLKAVAETYLTKTVGLTAPQVNALKQKLQ